ncbi:MAG: DUF4230 domain-containing protein [Micromonosporaceae bacterium]
MTARPIDDTIVDEGGYRRTTGEPDGPTGGRGLRRLLMLAGTIGVIGALVFGLKAVDLWPNFHNPFATKTTDRSGPVLLKSIQDMSRYVAAEGNFQVIVDVQKNKSFLPSWIYGERTLFIGVGSVDAYVDFSTIGDGAIVESADGQSVQIKLPAPVLDTPKFDVDHSYVYDYSNGAVNKLGSLFGGNPNGQQQVYQLANQKIAAAAQDSELRQRAEANTRAMLTSMLRSLGYQNVTITFAQP